MLCENVALLNTPQWAIFTDLFRHTFLFLFYSLIRNAIFISLIRSCLFKIQKLRFDVRFWLILHNLQKKGRLLASEIANLVQVYS